MKRITKRVINKITPNRVKEEISRLRRIEERLEELRGIVLSHDNRLDKLKTLAKEVEPYQPTYGISGILLEDPRRSSHDRCWAIEQYLGNISGLKFLDIGSSLGYVCYYLADRGGICEGWDANPKNTEVSRLVGDINGISVDIRTKIFDEESVGAIKPHSFDVIIILSVIHHILHYKGLKYTQKLMKELIEKTPILILELAKKGEDPKLFWDKSLPDSELEILDLVKDKIEILEIGTFDNHLSEKKRPLYVITPKKNFIKINNKIYPYETKTNQAYTNSPSPFLELRRYYYFSKAHIVKEYVFEGKHKRENSRQIISEIDKLLHLDNIYRQPKLLDYEITVEKARLVLEKINGELLVDLIEAKKSINPTVVATDVLKTLRDLEAQGLYHNDIRSWNILYDGEKATLIDYGVVSHKATDGDMNSLLWVINSILVGKREGYATKKKQLPEAKLFLAKPELAQLYESIILGEKSPSKILEQLNKQKSKKS